MRKRFTSQRSAAKDSCCEGWAAFMAVLICRDFTHANTDDTQRFDKTGAGNITTITTHFGVRRIIIIVLICLFFGTVLLLYLFVGCGGFLVPFWNDKASLSLLLYVSTVFSKCSFIQRQVNAKEVGILL